MATLCSAPYSQSQGTEQKIAKEVRTSTLGILQVVEGACRALCWSIHAFEPSPFIWLAAHLSIRGFPTAVLFFSAVYDGDSPQKLRKFWIM